MVLATALGLPFFFLNWRSWVGRLSLRAERVCVSAAVQIPVVGKKGALYTVPRRLERLFQLI